MKTKTNAKQRREAEEQRRKGTFSPKKPVPAGKPPEQSAAVKPKQPPVPVPDIPSQTPEEETREFLEYLDRYRMPGGKYDLPQKAGRKPKPAGNIPAVNLEEGMPVVDEAITRLRIGIQEMRAGQVRTVKLIHGYGSTGRGGKICIGVRTELAAMKRKKLIRDYIPGEDFGPTDAAARSLAEQNRAVTKDADYGRMNHGITIVIL